MNHLEIRISGRVVAADEMRFLSQLRVQQKLSLPSLCELTWLVDPNSEQPPSVDVGASLVVHADTVEGAGIVFAGEITGKEYVYNADEGCQLRMRAYDHLHRLRKNQKVAAHVQVTLKNLADDLLRDAAVRADVRMSDTGPSLLWRRLIQAGPSNFDFLARQAAACGLYFALRDGELIFFTLRGEGDAIPLELGRSLIEANLEINGNQAVRQVSASCWNPRLAEPRQVTATDPRVGRQVKARATPASLGAAAEFKTFGDVVEDSRQAEALAQAELDFRGAREVTLRGVATGNPHLRPGVRVQVDGVAAAVRGTYVLTEATHVMTGERGYQTEISSDPPDVRHRTQGMIVVLGKVCRVDDPEGFGRVQVVFPAYEGLESDWMQVVIPGGGKAKGIVALPDVDDLVLVLCADENPAMGMVLGGLYGAQAPPDAGVQGGRTRRFTVTTPGGHRLSLDDTQDLLRIEGSRGSYFEFTPDRVSLHAGADLEIKAPGKAVVVTGASIDFKQG
jgi:phage baseplate assembly protein gpV